ncbi:hypothetical protein N9134_00225 [Akkermansiaceae bacterium]|nr:hypothetical protein [Akkermansiaceae bacterium]MDB4406613.1 hypothetical protein [Akkermansiaceae bacterium]
MAANITSGNFQSYDPGHGIRIFEALDPDIVLIQEFNYLSNTDTQLDIFVAETFGAEFSYVEEGKSSGQIQNGVISRYPILQSGIWDDADMSNREFVWAQIDVPGDANLWVVSVHFKASSGSESRRTGEAEQLAGYITANVPAADYVVIGGDFNAQNRNEEFLTKLSPIVKVTAPWPVDRNGNGNTNSGRSKPYDWVMVEPDLDALEVPTVLGSRSYANGLVFDSRVYIPIGDVAPVLAADSGVAGMQHMAVMKTFDLPVDLYQPWLSENFPTRSPADEVTVWGELADPDQDGLVNFLEYAFGRDPNAPVLTLPILAVNLDGQNIEVTFPVLEDPNLTYQVEGATDLTDFTPVTGATTNDGSLIGLVKKRTVTLPPSVLRFFRVKVSR